MGDIAENTEEVETLSQVRRARQVPLLTASTSLLHFDRNGILRHSETGSSHLRFPMGLEQ